ncbi:MAG: hypothetical protein ABIS18_03815 [Actinomycetota bacterium]
MRRDNIQMKFIAGGLLAALSGLLTAMPVSAQVPFLQADFRGFATGSVMHADLLQTGDATTGSRVLNTDIAFSGATVDSKGLSTPVMNESLVVVQNALQGKNSFARGSGFEAGAFENVPVNPNDIIYAGLAQASAPPDSAETKEMAVPFEPVMYASILRGESIANWGVEGCVLGDDLSRGLGFSRDVQLFDADLTSDAEQTLEQPLLSLSAPSPERAVSQTVSRTRLVPQTASDGSVKGPAFGLSSQVRQTIAPITLFKGTPSQMTIEILGEWVLTATATGLANGAYIHYGPASTSPDTPILRTLDAEGVETRYFTLQDITGDSGLVVPLGFGELVIGEDPKAIGGDATTSPTTEADGTRAAASVDVVRLTIETDAMSVTNLRFGHMETSTQVPAGGIACGIKVTKSADKQRVLPNDEFTYTVVVHNTFDCILTDIKVVDTMTATPKVRFAILSETPAAANKTSSLLNFTLPDPLLPGATKEILIKIKVDPSSAAGLMTNSAVATANCGLSAAQAGVDINVAVLGNVTIHLPEVARVIPIRVLAATGEPEWRIWGGFVLLLAAALAAALRRRVSQHFPA